MLSQYRDNVVGMGYYLFVKYFDLSRRGTQMNNIHNLSPYIRVAMDSYIPFPWHLEERVLFDYEIIFLKEGKLKVTVEDRIYWGEPGDIFFFRPKQRHSIQKIGNGQVRQPHLHFDLFFQDDSPDVKVSFKNLEDMSSEEMRWFRHDDIEHLHFQLDSHIRLRQPLAVENLLFEIIREFQMKLPYFELNIKGLFVQLFTALIRETYWNRNPHLLSNINELEQVRIFLKHNIGKKVTVDELAKLSGISKYYLITLFV